MSVTPYESRFAAATATTPPSTAAESLLSVNRPSNDAPSANEGGKISREAYYAPPIVEGSTPTPPTSGGAHASAAYGAEQGGTATSTSSSAPVGGYTPRSPGAVYYRPQTQSTAQSHASGGGGQDRLIGDGKSGAAYEYQSPASRSAAADLMGTSGSVTTPSRYGASPGASYSARSPHQDARQVTDRDARYAADDLASAGDRVAAVTPYGNNSTTAGLLSAIDRSVRARAAHDAVDAAERRAYGSTGVALTNAGESAHAAAAKRQDAAAAESIAAAAARAQGVHEVAVRSTEAARLRVDTAKYTADGESLTATVQTLEAAVAAERQRAAEARLSVERALTNRDDARKELDAADRFLRQKQEEIKTEAAVQDHDLKQLRQTLVKAEQRLARAEALGAAVVATAASSTVATPLRSHTNNSSPDRSEMMNEMDAAALTAANGSAMPGSPSTKSARAARTAQVAVDTVASVKAQIAKAHATADTNVLKLEGLRRSLAAQADSTAVIMTQRRKLLEAAVTDHQAAKKQLALKANAEAANEERAVRAETAGDATGLAREEESLLEEGQEHRIEIAGLFERETAALAKVSAAEARLSVVAAVRQSITAAEDAMAGLQAEIEERESWITELTEKVDIATEKAQCLKAAVEIPTEDCKASTAKLEQRAAELRQRMSEVEAAASVAQSKARGQEKHYALSTRDLRGQLEAEIANRALAQEQTAGELREQEAALEEARRQLRAVEAQQEDVAERNRLLDLTLESIDKQRKAQEREREAQREAARTAAANLITSLQ